MVKILLIEDDPNQIKILKIRLEASGFQVLAASNAKDGIKLAQEEKPDLILIDMILPGMHGLEATMKLKEIPETKEIPIIAFTAMTTTGFKQACYREGICDFISKPFEPVELINKIKKNIGDKIKKKILIINNDSDLATKLEIALKTCGYKVIAALDPFSGLKQAHKESPDLILLNIALFEQEDYEVFLDLMNFPRTTLIPMAVISALLSPKELEVKVEEIVTQIKKILGEQLSIEAQRE
jgi:DNA-binding response OmpR family regulator